MGRVRQRFRSLADNLISQVGGEGRTPYIPKGPTRWDEQRDWDIGASGEFIVRPSRYQVETRIQLPAGTISDSGVLRQVLENEAANRELAIRDVYEQILQDAAGEN